MDLLYTFSGLAMCCSAVAALLPQGGLKRTAMLAMGLTVLALGAGALRDCWPDWSLPEAPVSILEHAGTADLEQTQQAWVQQRTQR